MARVVLALAVSAVLGACRPGSLQFVADHRVRFTSPRDRSLVGAPATMTWTVSGFAPTGLDGRSNRGAGAFAAFVDANPMPVGRDLHWVGRATKTCKKDPACVTPEFLATRNVYVTTASHLHLDVWPAATVVRGRAEHRVIIVLVDGLGRRIGESAWELDVHTHRSAT